MRSRFGEPSAPEKFDGACVQEMNPLSWCVVLRGRKPATRADAVAMLAEVVPIEKIPIAPAAE